MSKSVENTLMSELYNGLAFTVPIIDNNSKILICIRQLNIIN